MFSAELEEEYTNEFIEFVNGINSSAKEAQTKLSASQKLIPVEKMLDLSHDVTFCALYLIDFSDARHCFERLCVNRKNCVDSSRNQFFGRFSISYKR